MSHASDRTATLEVGGKVYTYYPVSQVAGAEKLPCSLTVLLENVLRKAESDESAALLAQRVVNAGVAGEAGSEIEFSPARVLFQDFTGVPVFVDFACDARSVPESRGRCVEDQPAGTVRPDYRPFRHRGRGRMPGVRWKRTCALSSSATANAMTS